MISASNSARDLEDIAERARLKGQVTDARRMLGTDAYRCHFLADSVMAAGIDATGYPGRFRSLFRVC